MLSTSELNEKLDTWYEGNILVTIGVLGPLCQELDPVLDLCHPGVDAVTRTLGAGAQHAYLGHPGNHA